MRSFFFFDHPKSNPNNNDKRKSTQPTTDLRLLPVTPEAHNVVPLPHGACGGTELVGLVSLVAETTVLASSAGQTTGLTALVGCLLCGGG